MDQKRIEQLVRELIELDPGLKAHEADLCAYMQQFEIGKPCVAIDHQFVSSLRAQLLEKGTPVPSPYVQLNWWALRLAPLGALALLLLMLIPPSPQTPAEIPVETARDDTRVMQTEIQSTPSALPPPMNNFGGSGGTEQDSSMSLKSTAAPQESSPIVVQRQLPGVSLQIESINTAESGFAVVYMYAPDGRETIIGISPIIYPGSTENVPINLRTRTITGGIYTVAFHRDNGDRLFDPTEDAEVRDGYGNPQSVPLIIGIVE